MKNIHILSIDITSRLFLSPMNNFKLSDDVIRNLYQGLKPQNIYITNDEDIKEGDYWYDYLLETINKGNLVGVQRGKKIILTTDQELIKDGVQAIDDEFLEWFVKNPSCEEVKVDKNWNYPLDKSWEYKIIIPSEEVYFDFTGKLDELPNLSDVIKKKLSKEEPKQDVIDYSLNAFKVPKEYFGKEEPKLPTTEELTEKIFCNNQETLEEGFKRIYNTIDFSEFDFYSFRLGTKWQQERSYSEEEVYNLLLKAIEDCYDEELEHHYARDYRNLKDWFEQFKKK